MTTITVSSGVHSSGLSVAGGDAVVVLSGGVTEATQVNQEGFEYVSGGGVASGSVLSGLQPGVRHGASPRVVTRLTRRCSYYRRLFILAHGVASNTVIDQLGIEVVDGVASSTTVHGGGHQRVNSGGVTSGTILSGGDEIVSSGGTA